MQMKRTSRTTETWVRTMWMGNTSGTGSTTSPLKASSPCTMRKAPWARLLTRVQRLSKPSSVPRVADHQQIWHTKRRCSRHLTRTSRLQPRPSIEMARWASSILSRGPTNVLALTLFRSSLTTGSNNRSTQTETPLLHHSSSIVTIKRRKTQLRTSYHLSTPTRSPSETVIDQEPYKLTKQSKSTHLPATSTWTHSPSEMSIKSSLICKLLTQPVRVLISPWAWATRQGLQFTQQRKSSKSYPRWLTNS